MSLQQVGSARTLTGNPTSSDASVRLSTNSSSVIGTRAASRNVGAFNAILGTDANRDGGNTNRCVLIGYMAADFAASDGLVCIGANSASALDRGIAAPAGRDSVAIGCSVADGTTVMDRCVSIGPRAASGTGGTLNTFVGPSCGDLGAGAATTAVVAGATGLGAWTKVVQGGDTSLVCGYSNCHGGRDGATLGARCVNMGARSVLIGADVTNTGAGCLLLAPGDPTARTPFVNSLDGVVDVGGVLTCQATTTTLTGGQQVNIAVGGRGSTPAAVVVVRTSLAGVAITGDASITGTLSTTASVNAGLVRANLVQANSVSASVSVVTDSLEAGVVRTASVYAVDSVTASSMSVSGALQAASATLINDVTADSVHARTVTAADTLRAATMIAAGIVQASGVNVNGDVSATGNILAANLVIAGTMQAASAVASCSTVTGNMQAGTVSVTDSVHAFTVTASGAMQAATVAASGNVQSGSVTVTGNVVAGGNVQAAGVVTNGAVAAGSMQTVGLVATGNVQVGSMTTIGPVQVGSVTTTGPVSAGSVQATGSVTAGNMTTGGLVASGNAQVGSVTSAGAVAASAFQATGSVTAANMRTVGLVASGGVQVGSMTATGGVTADTVQASSVTVSGAVLAGTVLTGSLVASGNVQMGSMTALGGVTAATVSASGGMIADSVQAGSLTVCSATTGEVAASQRWTIGVTPTSAVTAASDLIFNSGFRRTRFTITDDFVPGLLNFTAQHRCVFRPSGAGGKTEGISALVGRIVVTTGAYCDLDGRTGSVRIDEAVPVVQLSQRVYDTRAFGVISAVDTVVVDRGDEDVTMHDVAEVDGPRGVKRRRLLGAREYRLGLLRFTVPVEAVTSHQRRDEDEDDDDDEGPPTRLIINALGEGGIWVCDINGVFRDGDYITTSALPGLGMRQAEPHAASWTVAKITCDCDFEPATYDTVCDPVTGVRRAFVGCTYGR